MSVINIPSHDSRFNTIISQNLIQLNSFVDMSLQYTKKKYID
jgi:hypothetical protein